MRNTFRTCLLVIAAMAFTDRLGAQALTELPAADRVSTIAFQQVYSVGGGAAEWEQFEELKAAAFGQDGRLYLLDSGADAVVVLDRSGSFLRRVGRRGDGPGEFRGAEGLIAQSAGRVAVWAPNKRRFVMFDSAGAALDEIAVGQESGQPGGPFFLASDGRVLTFPARIVTGRLGHAYLTGNGVKKADAGLPLLRFHVGTGAQVEVVTHAGMPVPPTGSASVRRAYEPLPSFGPLSNGRVALHEGEEYRVRIMTEDGSVERIISRPLRPRAITAADREAFEQSQQQLVAKVLGQGGRSVPPTVPPVTYHPVLPPLMGIVSDGRNRIWLQRRDDTDPTRPGAIDIVTAEGAYAGTLAAGTLPGLPAAFGPDGLIVVLTTGGYDVPVARVYRLPRSLR